MLENFVRILSLTGRYNDPNYIYLTDKEKKDLEFIDSCIYSDNENINNTSFYLMMLVLEIANDPDSFIPEVIQERENAIINNLTDEEKVTMKKFFNACINSLGVLNEENINQRKLEKKGMNK